MSSELIDGLGTTDALDSAFDDAAFLGAMLNFEIALARVQSHLGLLPRAAADSIAASADSSKFDVAGLVAAGRSSGTIAIPFVRALTEHVRARDPQSAGFVHWGATSQDVSDTALVLCLKRARGILGADCARLTGALRTLSDNHAETVMLGRTLLQPAPPVTFGLKAAGWFASVRRSWADLDRAFDRAIVLQFGGASGTLAALGTDGAVVSAGLAEALGLAEAPAPWHTTRDRLASMVTRCGVLTGAVGKIARDISLLMQDEVGEVAESEGGGSSTMPQKRNPSRSAVAIASATRVPGLVASFLSGLVQEHERAVGTWHAEASTVTAVVKATGAGLAAMAQAVETLSIDPQKMRANIAATNGLVFAERLMMLTAPAVGRDVAHRLVGEAVKECQRSGRSLADVARTTPDIARAVGAGVLDELQHPARYLGAAELFRQRLLADAE